MTGAKQQAMVAKTVKVDGLGVAWRRRFGFGLDVVAAVFRACESLVDVSRFASATSRTGW